MGIFGGLLAIYLILTFTSSQLRDIGGPVDWLLAAGVYVAGAIGTAIAVCIMLTLFAPKRLDRTQAFRK